MIDENSWHMAEAVLADHNLRCTLSSFSVGSGRPNIHLKRLSRSTIVELWGVGWEEGVRALMLHISVPLKHYCAELQKLAVTKGNTHVPHDDLFETGENDAEHDGGRVFDDAYRTRSTKLLVSKSAHLHARAFSSQQLRPHQSSACGTL